MANYNPQDALVTDVYKREKRNGKEVLIPAKYRLVRYNADAGNVDQLIETLPGAQQGFGDTATSGGNSNYPVEGIETSSPLPYSDVFRLD